MSKSSPVTDAVTTRYLDAFAAQERAHRGPAFLRPLKDDALARFSAAGFPTRQNEEWRSTSLKRISDLNLKPHALGDRAEPLTGTPPVVVEDALTIQIDNGRVVLDGIDVPAGVRVSSLATLQSAPAAGTPLASLFHVATAATAMADLNTAFVEDALLVEIDDDAVVDRLIHVSHRVGHEAQGVEVFPRVFVHLGKNAKARVLETWTHHGGAATMANGVGEVVLDAGAHLEHVIVHDTGALANLVLTTSVHQAAHSSYTERGFWLSGGLVRHDLQVKLAEETATCTLDGLALTGGTSLVDGHYAVDHVVGNCQSAQRFRTVLDDSSVAVFNGKVIMRRGADKSDAQQENHNLLLSRDAEVFAKPQLEIFADDVKASHGSTVGQLDETALFYLRARGIGFEDAQRMLISAFAESLVDDVQLETVATQIRHLVDKRLAQTLGTDPLHASA